MKKFRIVLIIGISILISSVLIFNVRTYYCFAHYLTTDKDTYYPDESIKINASWELNYDSEWEDSYVQIRMFDSKDDKIWNSSEYSEIGTYQRNWTLNITNLDTGFINDSISLSIKLWWYYFDIDTQLSISVSLESIEIDIVPYGYDSELDEDTSENENGDDFNFDLTIPGYPIFILLGFLSVSTIRGVMSRKKSKTMF